MFAKGLKIKGIIWKINIPKIEGIWIRGIGLENQVWLTWIVIRICEIEYQRDADYNIRTK